MRFVSLLSQFLIKSATIQYRWWAYIQLISTIVIRCCHFDDYWHLDSLLQFCHPYVYRKWSASGTMTSIKQYTQNMIKSLKSTDICLYSLYRFPHFATNAISIECLDRFMNRYIYVYTLCVCTMYMRPLRYMITKIETICCP